MKTVLNDFSLKNSWDDITTLPRLGRGVLAVWQRNFLYYRATLTTSVFWAVFEPVLYLVAMGFGLGGFIGKIEDVSYIEFFYPALLTTTAMTISFFESTYGSFTKLVPQKTYSTILLSPVQASEIVFGEILWGASKGFFSVLAVTLVSVGFDLVHSWRILPALLILLLTCWVFSAMGMLATSMARNYDSFIYAISGFIVPMTLFSGTYFPLSSLPKGIKTIAYVLPLTHAVSPVRGLLLDRWEPWMWGSLSALFVLGLLLTNWSITRLERKLIY